MRLQAQFWRQKNDEERVEAAGCSSEMLTCLLLQPKSLLAHDRYADTAQPFLSSLSTGLHLCILRLTVLLRFFGGNQCHRFSTPSG
jgi:hypothetical protein